MLLTYALLGHMRRSVRLAPDRLRALQERRLRALVRHAYEEVPYYRRLMDAAGVGPDDVRTADDLPRLPFTTKDLLRRTPLADLLARGVTPGRCAVLESSGSSGTPLRVYKRPREERFRRAVGLRILLEHGFRWRNRSAQFQQRAGPAVWLQRLGVGRKHWISTSLGVETQIRLLAAARAQVVIGPPTALRAVARAADAAGLTLAPARIVVAAGELLDPATRALVRRVLAADPVAVYGTTEMGYLAWQCERRAGLHVSADTHLIELLRGETPAPAGTLGEIVVTDLVARAMPLVRYRTGDLAVAPLAQCPCGRSLPLLVAHGGRLAGTLQLPGGRLVTAADVVGALDGMCRLGTFVVVQDVLDAVRLELLPAPDGPDEPAAARALAALGQLVAPLRVAATRAGTMPGAGTGKTPIVLSRLPAPF